MKEYIYKLIGKDKNENVNSIERYEMRLDEFYKELEKVQKKMMSPARETLSQGAFIAFRNSDGNHIDEKCTQPKHSDLMM